MSTELWRLSAGEMFQQLEGGDVSSRELVDAHLDRVAEVNPKVNAIVEVLADQARDAADAADRQRRSGTEVGPFHGVPITVKTNIDVTGSSTHEGMPGLMGLVATSDAPIVSKMRGAGAIVLGRTNMPDFGLRINTVSSLHGATHNPWRHGVTAGGSSGGEAAAIASGMSPLGLGNDIGGSVRNPAFACGIASIKPSFGRVAQGNDTSQVSPMLSSQLMLAQGVLARTVADVRSGLEVVMGSDARDPFAVDAPLQGEPVARRVALVPEPAGGSTHPAIADGVRAAGEALRAEGFDVEEVSPPELVESYLAWSELMVSETQMVRPLLDRFMGDEAKAFLDLTNAGFPEPTPASLLQMHQSRHRISKAWRSFLNHYPVIIGPTWTQPPFSLGFDIESQASAFAVLEIFRFVLPANLMGLPAACVPTGIADGLPTGVQIISSRFREDLCLDTAEAIERRLGTFTPIDPR